MLYQRQLKQKEMDYLSTNYIKIVFFVFGLFGIQNKAAAQDMYKHHLIGIGAAFGRYGENTMTEDNLTENNSSRGISLSYTYRIQPRIGFHLNFSRLTCPEITNSNSRHTVLGVKFTTKANRRLQFFVLPVIGVGKYQTWDILFNGLYNQYKFKTDYRNIDVGLTIGFDIHVTKFMFLSFQSNLRTSAQRFNGYTFSSIGAGFKF